MNIATSLASIAFLTLGGCLSISTGCGQTRERIVTVPAQQPAVSLRTTPAPWPPTHLTLDSKAIYVTGVSNLAGAAGQEQARVNAMNQAHAMGLGHALLSDVYHDPQPLGTRILYRVVPAPVSSP